MKSLEIVLIVNSDRVTIILIGLKSDHLTKQHNTNRNSKLKHATRAKRGKTQTNEWKTRLLLVFTPD